MTAKIGFDFVCDEAPLFGKVAQKLQADGHQIFGLTMGKRWSNYWDGIFRHYPIGVAHDESVDVDSEFRRIEKTYSRHSPASFALADRFLAFDSREFQRLAIVRTFQSVEEAFAVEKPDIYFSTGVAYLYNLVTLAVCQENNIPHLSLYCTRDEKPRFTVSYQKGGTWDLVDEAYQELLSGAEPPEAEYAEAQQFIKDFREQAGTPFYMLSARQSHGMRSIFVREFITRLRRWYVEGWGREKGDYITQHPWWYVKRDVRKLLQGQWIIRHANKIFDPVNLNDIYYIFPLHLQPEASTLILSEWYVNQLETIRNLSKTIPADSYLYVKEHISALGRHTLKFYNDLKAIHNVKLITPFANTLELISNSRGVIILSGTMGWESIILKCPAYVLGHVFFTSTVGAEQVNGFDHLREILAEHKPLCWEQIYGNSDDSLIKYLIAIKRRSYDGMFDVAKMDISDLVLAEDNVNSVYHGIADLVKKKSVCLEEV